MQENEMILKRLQESKSIFNVYDWDKERQISKKRVKAICRFEPSLLERTRSKRRHSPRKRDGSIDKPNEALYELYKESVEQQQYDYESQVSRDPLLLPSIGSSQN